jgi:hypothetical protein
LSSSSRVYRIECLYVLAINDRQLETSWIDEVNDSIEKGMPVHKAMMPNVLPAAGDECIAASMSYSSGFLFY